MRHAISDHLHCGPRHHHPVVRAQPRRRQHELPAAPRLPGRTRLIAQHLQSPPQLLVRRHAARHHECGRRAAPLVVARLAQLHRILDPLLEVRDGRMLEGRRHVGEEVGLGPPFGRRALDRQPRRSLEPSEREVVVLLRAHRHRQRHAGRVPPPRERLERRAAAAADGEVEQPGHLVVRLAQRVVERRADHLVLADASREEELAVAA
mmetsp:Transcript_11200/g.27714  ORF Transcript_11200/g.27714 Transcript_11200/m.27714 type:complete len:207 (+) Transcript_11200:506-1126(+)